MSVSVPKYITIIFLCCIPSLKSWSIDVVFSIPTQSPQELGTTLGADFNNYTFTSGRCNKDAEHAVTLTERKYANKCEQETCKWYRFHNGIWQEIEGADGATVILQPSDMAEGSEDYFYKKSFYIVRNPRDDGTYDTFPYEGIQRVVVNPDVPIVDYYDEYVCGQDFSSPEELMQLVRNKYPTTTSVYRWDWDGNKVDELLHTPKGGTTTFSQVVYKEFAFPFDSCRGEYPILQVAVHIGVPYTEVTTATICEGETYYWDIPTGYKSKPLKKAGTYRDTLPSSHGCDSIYYTLNLKIHKTYPNKPISATICGDVTSYEWHIAGETVDVPIPPGKDFVNYNHTVTYTSTGCDSVTFRLGLKVVKNVDPDTIDTLLCYNTPLRYKTDTGFLVLKEEGTYTATSKIGTCNKVTTINIRYRDKPTEYIEPTRYVCQDSTYFWNPLDEPEPHIYKATKYGYDYKHITLPTLDGLCDSIIYTLPVMVKRRWNYYRDESMCAELPFRLQENGHDTTLFTEGKHTLVFNYTDGSCDCPKDVYHLTLTREEPPDIIRKDTFVPYGAIFPWCPFENSKCQYVVAKIDHSCYYDTLRGCGKRSQCDCKYYELCVTTDTLPGTHIFLIDTACLGDSYFWVREGKKDSIINQKDEASIYLDTVFFNDGDSIVYYHLYLRTIQLRNEEESRYVCSSNISWHGKTIRPIGHDSDYYDTVLNSARHCDGIRYHLHAYNRKIDTISLIDTFCGAGDYEWYTKDVSCPVLTLTVAPLDKYRYVCKEGDCYYTRDIFDYEIDNWYYQERYYPEIETHIYSYKRRGIISGCDSAFYTLNLHRNYCDTFVTDTTICAGDLPFWWHKKDEETVRIWPNNDPHDVTTTYEYHEAKIPYKLGTEYCDSIVDILHLHIQRPIIKDTTMSTCNTAKWYTYKKSKRGYPINVTLKNKVDTFYDTARTMIGCDSVYYVLYLSGYPVTRKDTIDTVCGTDTYYWQRPDGTRTCAVKSTNKFYNFYDTLRYQNGCDSIIYKLLLVRLYSLSPQYARDTVCAGCTYDWYSKNGTLVRKGMVLDTLWRQYTDTLRYRGTKACDSVECHLTLFRQGIVARDSIVDTVCGYRTYPWRKQCANVILIENIDSTRQPTDRGIHRDTIRYSTTGCDSAIFILDLRRQHARVVVDSVTLCECVDGTCSGGRYEYDWYTDDMRVPHQTIYSKDQLAEDTIYYHIIPYCGIVACDSICYKCFVHINKVKRETFNVTICDGETYEWYTHDKTTPVKIISQAIKDATYYDTAYYMSTGGRVCDSVYYTLNLHVLIPDTVLTDTFQCIDGTQTTLWKIGEEGGYRKDSTIEHLQESRNFIDTLRTKRKYCDKICDSVYYMLHLNVITGRDSTYPDTVVCPGDVKIWQTWHDKPLYAPVTCDDTTFRDTFYSDITRCAETKYEIVVHTFRPTYVGRRDTICADSSKWWCPDETKFPDYWDSLKRAGIYTIVIPNRYGCDSVIYTDTVVVLDYRVDSKNINLCFPDAPYEKEYDWYGNDGIFLKTITSKERDEDYDSIIYHENCLCEHCAKVKYHLHIHQQRTINWTLEDTICSQTDYQWYDPQGILLRNIIQTTPSETYKYTLPFKGSYTCDSLNYTLHLTRQDYTTVRDTDTICGEDTYIWGCCGREIHQATELGDYSFTEYYEGTHQCEKVRHYLHLVRQDVQEVSYTDTLCVDDTYLWTLPHKTWTFTASLQQDTDYYDTVRYVGTKHCDSIHYHLHLTSLHYTTDTVRASICADQQPYTWYSQKDNTLIRDDIRQRKADEVYYHTAYYSGTQHCDSVRYVLYLHNDTVTDAFYTSTFCKGDEFLWLSIGTGETLRVINQNAPEQLYTLKQTYRSGCDSIFHNLRLQMLYPTDSTDNLFACYGHSVWWHGHEYTRTVTDIEHLDNTAGCDSLCTLHVTIAPDKKIIKSDTVICPNHIIEWFGQIVGSAGTYTHTDTTYYGCDSIEYILSATVADTTMAWEDRTTCYQDLPFHWHERSYYETGIYTDTLLNAQGCDSICYLHLSVSEPLEYCITDTLLCIGRTMYWREFSITEPGTYRDTLFNRNHCDSAYFILNVDTIDCCIHLTDVHLKPLDVICADDKNFTYQLSYSKGIPDSFTISFDAFATSYGFRQQQGVFLQEDIYPDQAFLPIMLPSVSPYVRPNAYRLYIDLIDSCGRPYHFSDSIQVYYPSWIVDQHWNDVLAVLNDQYNGGYTFSDYQWYKNDSVIYSATGDHYYLPATFNPTARYNIRVTRTDDGYTTFSCPIIVHSVIDSSVLTEPYIYVYPTVVPAEDPYVTIISNMSGNYWVYDLVGKLVNKGAFVSLNEGSSVVRISSTPATYILHTSPQQKKKSASKNFIIFVE